MVVIDRFEVKAYLDFNLILCTCVAVSVRGNEMANIGHYQAAINLFTEAIKLDPQDFR